MNRPTWRQYFLTIAHVAALRSPDAQTKVGCVLANSKNQIVSIGYNGFPRQCKDDKLPTTRPDKYPYIIHAEENAIYNAVGPLDEIACYTTCEPCYKCLMKLYHLGIRYFFWPSNPLYKPSCVDATDLSVKEKFFDSVLETIVFQPVVFQPECIFELSEKFAQQSDLDGV